MVKQNVLVVKIVELPGTLLISFSLHNGVTTSGREPYKQCYFWFEGKTSSVPKLVFSIHYFH